MDKGEDKSMFVYKNSNQARAACKKCYNLSSNLIACGRCPYGGMYCGKCIDIHRESNHNTTFLCGIEGCKQKTTKKNMLSCRNEVCIYNKPSFCSDDCRSKHELLHWLGHKCNYKMCDKIYGKDTLYTLEIHSYPWLEEYFCSVIHKTFAYVYEEDRCKICANRKCDNHDKRCRRCGYDRVNIDYTNNIYICTRDSCKYENACNLINCECGNKGVMNNTLYCSICKKYQCSYECLFDHYIAGDEKHRSQCCLESNCKEMSPINELKIKCRSGCCSYCSIKHKDMRIQPKPTEKTACKTCGCINKVDSEIRLCSKCSSGKCDVCEKNSDIIACKLCSAVLCSQECIDTHARLIHKPIVCGKFNCGKDSDETFKCGCGKGYCSFVHFAESNTHLQCGTCLCIHSDGNWFTGTSMARCVNGHVICRVCTNNNAKKCKLCMEKDNVLTHLCNVYRCTLPVSVICTCGIGSCSEHSAANNRDDECVKCGCNHKGNRLCSNKKCRKFICDVCWEKWNYCSEECIVASKPKLPPIICARTYCHNEIKILKECSCGGITIRTCSEECYKIIMLPACPTCGCIHNNPRICDEGHHLCEKCWSEGKKCKLCTDGGMPEILASQLRKEDEKEEDYKCKICFEKDIDVVILECGHFCICSGCSAGVVESKKGCPVCRNPITNIKKIYKS